MAINDGHPVAGQRVRVRGTDKEGTLAMERSRGFYLEIGENRHIMAWFVYFPDGEVRTYDISHLEIID